MTKVREKQREGDFSVNTYMTEGVGKRIVDALKKQNEVEYFNQTNTQPQVKEESVVTVNAEPETEQIVNENFDIPTSQDVTSEILFTEPSYSTQPSFNTMNMQNNIYSNLSTDFGGIEVPANVAVLKQLIAQLPSGVSRQAGALVIKQTMEALGTSMKSVLQEAQQLQENINISARECQNSILECKKQINTLEAQVQKYQKQSASLNEIISLFVQIN